jgi:hypothetical protein
MASRFDPPETRQVLPHQLAWLRRQELDTPGAQVWELPDGTLHAARPDEKLKLHCLRRPEPPG